MLHGGGNNKAGTYVKSCTMYFHETSCHLYNVGSQKYFIQQENEKRRKEQERKQAIAEKNEVERKRKEREVR